MLYKNSNYLNIVQKEMVNTILTSWDKWMELNELRKKMRLIQLSEDSVSEKVVL